MWTPLLKRNISTLPIFIHVHIFSNQLSASYFNKYTGFHFLIIYFYIFICTAFPQSLDFSFLYVIMKFFVFILYVWVIWLRLIVFYLILYHSFYTCLVLAMAVNIKQILKKFLLFSISSHIGSGSFIAGLHYYHFMASYLSSGTYINIPQNNLYTFHGPQGFWWILVLVQLKYSYKYPLEKKKSFNWLFWIFKV